MSMKTRLKAEIAKTRVYKKESQKLLQANDGIHSFEWYAYQEERKALRTLYLVYGFSRGKSYAEIEPNTRTEPDWHGFRKIAIGTCVYRPHYKGWCGKPEDLWGGLPVDLLLKVKEEAGMEKDIEGIYDNRRQYNADWLAKIREVVTDPPRNLDSYLKMEEWILEAKKHYWSQPDTEHARILIDTGRVADTEDANFCPIR